MVSTRTRRFVRQRARNLCEYCHSSEDVSPILFTIDHLLPRSLGGADNAENLALACHRCNERRYNFTTAIDPETQQEIPLFNPRQQQWIDHFIWSANGQKIIAITPTGRATGDRLDFNDEFHDDSFIQESRQYWIGALWHPPHEDPRQESE